MEQKILTSTVNVEKNFFYKFVEPWLGQSLPILSKNYWRERRRILTPAFHLTILNEYIDIMVKNSRILVDRLEAELSSDQFDICGYITDCSLDIISETAMHVKLDVQKGSSGEYVNAIHEFLQLSFSRLFNPFFHLDLICLLTGRKRKLKKITNVLHDTSMRIIEQRIADRKENRNFTDAHEGQINSESKKGKSFLDILLDMADHKDNFFTTEIIRGEVDTFMFAGHDTVAAAISWTIFLVGHHPDVQTKIYAELDAVIPDKDDPLTVHTLNQLEYLECVIKEAMRLYSPAPMIARVLTEPVTLGEFTIPAGADVVIHLHQIHHSPQYYNNPFEFNPSNFAGSQMKNRHSFAYLPFSAGPRNCIGQKFGKMAVKITLTSFFKRYMVESLKQINDMTIFSEGVIRPEHSIDVRIRRRS